MVQGTHNIAFNSWRDQRMSWNRYKVVWCLGL